MVSDVGCRVQRRLGDDAFRQQRAAPCTPHPKPYTLNPPEYPNPKLLTLLRAQERTRTETSRCVSKCNMCDARLPSGTTRWVYWRDVIKSMGDIPAFSQGLVGRRLSLCLSVSLSLALSLSLSLSLPPYLRLSVRNAAAFRKHRLAAPPTPQR